MSSTCSLVPFAELTRGVVRGASTQRLILLLLLTLPFGHISGEARPLAEPSLVGGGRSYPPKITYGAGRFFTSAEGSSYGWVLDPAGRPVSPRPVTLPVPPSESLEVIGTDTSFAVFRSAGKQKHLTELDANFNFMRDRALDLPAELEVLGWNGNSFLTAIHEDDDSTTLYQLLNRSGDIRSGELPVRVNGARVRSVEPAGNRFILAYGDEHRLYVRTIARGRPSLQQIVDHAPSGGVVLAKGSDTDSTLAVWRGAYSPSRPHTLKMAIVGNTSQPTVRVLEVSDIYSSPLAAARLGDGYVVVVGGACRANCATRVVRIWRISLDGEPVGKPVETELAIQSLLSIAASKDALLLAGGANGLRHIAVDGSLQVRVSDEISLIPTKQHQLDLEAGGGRILATWTEERIPPVVRAVLLDNGEPVADTLLQGRSAGPGSVAWNGSEFLVLHYADLKGDTLYATRLDANARPIGDQIALERQPHMPPAAVVWAGDRWFIADSDLDFQTVSAAGIAGPHRGLHVNYPSRFSLPDPDSIALAFDGEEIVVAWTHPMGIPCAINGCPPRVADMTAYAARFKPDGSPVDDPFEPLKLSRGTDVRISIASSGRNFLVALGKQVFALDKSSGVLRVTESRRLIDWSAVSAVTWDGQNYLVALFYEGKSSSYFAAHKLHRDGSTAEPPRGSSTPGSEVLYSSYPWLAVPPQPSIAATDASNYLVGLLEGFSVPPARAVGYRSHDLPHLPPLPSAPKNVRMESLRMGYTRITWDPPVDGSDVDGYAVEGFSEENPMRILTFLGPEERECRVVGTNLRVRAFNAGGMSALPPRRSRTVGR